MYKLLVCTSCILNVCLLQDYATLDANEIASSLTTVYYFKYLKRFFKTSFNFEIVLLRLYTQSSKVRDMKDFLRQVRIDEGSWYFEGEN